MNNFTILIQGKLDYDCLNFNIKKYSDIPIVISTWEDEIETIPIKKSNNVKIIFNKIPEKCGSGNFNLQCISTLKGLELVDTNIVIKIRGDEYYSNLLSLVPNIIEKRKIYCSPIFFRSMKIEFYHISDHLIVGYKSDIYAMFKNSYASFLLESDINNTGNSKEYCLTSSYLKYKGYNHLFLGNNPIIDNINEGKLAMIENFDIINLELLKPYKIVSNFLNYIWYDNFDPNQEWSIDKIEDL